MVISSGVLLLMLLIKLVPKSILLYGAGKSCKGQIKFLFSIVNINLLGLKRIRDSDFKNNFVIMKREK
jgi:hypothetical protein